jgi:sugar lactone lactonase YvrE
MKMLATGFKHPGAVRFGKDGALLVLDDATGQLWALDNAGAKRLIAQLSSATDNMAVANDGRIYVSNMADNSIEIVDPRTGNVQLLLKGALAFPRDIAFAEGRLYVSDTYAFRSVDPRSGAVTDLARAVRDALHAPTAISASRSHVLLISEYLGVVQLADPATGKLGAVTDGFDRPSDAIELDDGRLVVAEPFAGRLVLVSGKDRSVLAEGLGRPSGLANGGDGWLYVAESGAGLVSRIRIDDGRREIVVGKAGAPRAVALMKEGLLILDGAGQRLLLHDRSGRLVTLARDLPVGHLSQPFVRSGGIAASPDGTIYVAADRENAIYALRRRR